jgi:digeranylgeranylglycerophospholipid reductase
VIGGGPAGSSAAARTSAEGLSTLILESKKEIGVPVQCGEVISDRALEYSGIGNGDWLVHDISRYRIISPSGDHVYSSTKGYCIDRHLFDRELAQIAMSNGAEISTFENVISCKRRKEGWQVSTGKRELGSRAIVLAAGTSSHLNDDLGLTSNRDVMKGLGAKIRREDASNTMDFYVKRELDSGYGWYFPRGKEVNIGVASRTDLRKWFDWFLRRLDIDVKEIVTFHGGIIPDGGPLERFVGEDVIAVGDSGGFCHPVSKGGIYCAMYSGRGGGDAVVEHLSGNLDALTEWEDDIRSHPGFSMENVRRRDFLAGFDDRTLDDITSIMDGCDVQTVDRKKIALRVARRPSLYPVITKGMTMVKHGRDWLDHSF